MGSTPDPVYQLAAILRGEAVALSNALVLGAAAHRVEPLVAWRTGRVDEHVRADALLDELEVVELNRVLATLEARGIAPLVFKGAALAHTHYDHSWLRPRLDADLLIPPGRRQDVFDVLDDCGYRQAPVTSGDLVSHQMMCVREGPLGREHVLDVHWRVLNPPLIADVLTYDEIASRACIVTVRRQGLRTPSAPDSLLLACVHRAVHHRQAADLLWIYDLHLIATRLGPQDWQAFVDLACDRRVAALCAAGLQLSIKYFETTVPRAVMARLSSPDGRHERSAVYLRTDLTRFDELRIDMRALGARAGMQLIWEHVAPPRSYMHRKYGVRHAAVLPALYARRVVEGAVKWLTRAG